MKYHLRLTKGMAKNSEGLELLRLALWDETHELDHVHAVSGQPGRQTCRLGADSQPGSMEPIPQGHYLLGSPAWAGHVGDFATVWNDGLGPVVIDISNQQPGQTARAELRIHADWNEDYAPGTAGCIGIQGETGPRDLVRLQQVLAWFKLYAPSWLDVAWGL